MHDEELRALGPWRCLECGALEAPYVCGGCRSVAFCNLSCQRRAWSRHKAACRLVKASTHREDAWLMLQGADAFPGQDAGTVLPPGAAASARRRCEAEGLGGFVLCKGAAYLRSQPPEALLAAARRAVGSTLCLSASALASSWRSAGRSFRLPGDLPEVSVPGARGVPKRAKLGEREMTARFEPGGEPIVLTDAQDGWPARSKWTFAWFAKHFGEEELLCSDLAPFFRHSDRGEIRTVTASMKEYVRYIRGKSNGLRCAQQSDGRVFYANAWSPFSRHPHLMDDVSDRLYCVRDSIPRDDSSAGGTSFNRQLTKVFLGPAGTVSRLHHDTYATHVWLSQIRGRKQFICYPPEDFDKLHCHPEDEAGGRTTNFDPSQPDYVAFPRARYATAYSVVVEEGETVVLPSRWFHWAKSLTPSITLMRNFVNELNMQEFARMRMRATRTAT